MVYRTKYVVVKTKKKLAEGSRATNMVEISAKFLS